MKKLLLLFLTLLVITQARAQPTERATGLLFDDAAYDTLDRLADYEGSKDSRLPMAVDLSPYCPEVRNQGDIFSCVGWAVGYGAMTIEKAIRNNWTDKAVISENAYSALYIYNQINTGTCRQGAQLTAAMELLRTRGDCPAAAFDHDIENCEKLPDPQLIALARRDTIDDFLTLFGTGDAPALKVQKVKKALAQQRPVVIGMAIRQNFYQLQKAQYWWPDLGNTAPAGGHALVVVGYDDQVQAFLLFNSWGKNWGDEGYIRVKYEHFGQYCKYGYILHKTEASIPEIATVIPSEVEGPDLATPTPQHHHTPTPPHPHTPTPPRPLLHLSGAAQLKYLSGYSAGDEPLFEMVNPSGQGGHYRFPKPWEVGQLFQLQAIAQSAELYLYVFTVDAQNNVNIHWPRREGFNLKFAGRHESAFVGDTGGSTTIPGQDKALQLAHPGQDIMYFLFSAKKIRGLKFICEKMRYTQADFIPRLRQIMGAHLIPPADIRYEAGSMGFQASTRSEGYIVPIVLEVTSIVAGANR